MSEEPYTAVLMSWKQYKLRPTFKVYFIQN